jgi:hypothetical protein
MGQQRRPLWLKKERRSQPTGPNIGLGYLTDLMVWILQAKSPFRLPFWTFRPSFFFGLFFFLFFLFLALIPLFFLENFYPTILLAISAIIKGFWAYPYTYVHL